MDKCPWRLRRTNVDWHYYPDYSDHCAAGGLQRHRRRAILRHGLLRGWRPWTYHRDPADPAIAGEVVAFSVIPGRAQARTGNLQRSRDSGFAAARRPGM